MATATHSRKLKLIEFSFGSTQFECQVSNWQIVNNTEDGDKLYTYCPDGEFREEADDNYALELTFFSDWRLNGISDFLVANNGTDANFTLKHHPGISGETVQWTGSLKLKAPSVGGAVRTTESQTVTMPIYGKPVYTRL